MIGRGPPSKSKSNNRKHDGWKSHSCDLKRHFQTGIDFRHRRRRKRADATVDERQYSSNARCRDHFERSSRDAAFRPFLPRTETKPIRHRRVERSFSQLFVAVVIVHLRVVPSLCECTVDGWVGVLRSEVFQECLDTVVHFCPQQNVPPLRRGVNASNWLPEVDRHSVELLGSERHRVFHRGIIAGSHKAPTSPTH